ncbi:ParB/RepB/Spo0J family partition protein [Magnetovibrio sp.]|uniref:ParB/RepB/Spo0J family partition protein n=1 Tax=Magnetovibrio sp. TaxID=2024836 RepID=UPI002F939E61
MKIIEIKLSDIDASKRFRPVDPEVVDQLAESIQARGLRQPVEIAKQNKGKPFRLVTGGHRYFGSEKAGMETIPAVLLTGDDLQLRSDELLENLERSELTALERAQHYAELKALFLEGNPEAKHGGDRRSADFQDANLAAWSDTVVTRTQRSRTTVERAARIGARLTKKAAEILRGTDFEDNQSELEALAKLEPQKQVKVVKVITSEKDDAPKTVTQAIKVIDGHTEAAMVDPVEALANKLQDNWNRTIKREPKAARRFLEHLIEEGVLAAGSIKGIK